MKKADTRWCTHQFYLHENCFSRIDMKKIVVKIDANQTHNDFKNEKSIDIFKVKKQNKKCWTK